jgi:hypothetical protein
MVRLSGELVEPQAHHNRNNHPFVSQIPLVLTDPEFGQN